MNTAKPRVLCVDASKDICAIESALLEHAGFEVESARGVTEALELSRRDRFDLFLVAYKITGGTGLELCRRLRARDADTPIIFWSALVYPSDKQAALDAGANAFLRKPDDLKLLTATAKGVLTATKASGTGPIK